MTDYPKISVVTITYGHENYITQTLDGVLMQQYAGEIEFIIADDKSPDATEEVVANYLSQKSIPNNILLKYTKHQINKGAPSNFSWAINQTSGKYIALCEGDDYWTDPLKLQKQVGFLEQNPLYSLCFTAKSNINTQGVVTGESRYGHQKTWSVEDVLDGSFIAGLQTIVSKNLSHEFNEFCTQFPDRTGVDRLYSYFYGTKGKLNYIDDNTAVYRVHEGGIWSRLSAKEKMVAHLKQHSFFLEKIAQDQLHFKHLERNMFRILIKHEYFQFNHKPLETFKNLFFLFSKYKLSPEVFLFAAKDYLGYYYELLKLKLPKV